MLRITVHPEPHRPTALATVDTIIAVGQTPGGDARRVRRRAGPGRPALPRRTAGAGQVLVWERSAGQAPFRLHVAPGKTERRRHSRKYAEGELPPDRSFYFRGPAGQAQPAGAEPDPVPADGRRRRRRDVDLPPAPGRLLALVPRDDQGRGAGRRGRARREDVGRDAGREPARSIREAVERKYTAPAAPLPMPGTDAEAKSV